MPMGRSFWLSASRVVYRAGVCYHGAGASAGSSMAAVTGTIDDGGGWGRGWISRPLLVLLMPRHLSCKSLLKLENSGPLGRRPTTCKQGNKY